MVVVACLGAQVAKIRQRPSGRAHIAADARGAQPDVQISGREGRGIMTCTICGRHTEEDQGDWCAVIGCDQWIGDCCSDGIAMCERHFHEAMRKAGV